jgi:hypothetical protein
MRSIVLLAPRYGFFAPVWLIRFDDAIGSSLPRRRSGGRLPRSLADSLTGIAGGGPPKRRPPRTGGNGTSALVDCSVAPALSELWVRPNRCRDALGTETADLEVGYVARARSVPLWGVDPPRCDHVVRHRRRSIGMALAPVDPAIVDVEDVCALGWLLRTGREMYEAIAADLGPEALATVGVAETWYPNLPPPLRHPGVDPSLFRADRGGSRPGRLRLPTVTERVDEPAQPPRRFTVEHRVHGNA